MTARHCIYPPAGDVTTAHAPLPSGVPTPLSEDVMLAAEAALERAWRRQHGGQTPTIPARARALKISTSPAGALRPTPNVPATPRPAPVVGGAS